MRLADSLYRNVLLPPVKALTRNDAEVAHNWFLAGMRMWSKHPRLIKGNAIDAPELRQTLMDGVEFPNPFGTAAGMDKTGGIYTALAALTGVGHVELGGVTLKAQPGNDRPRLVRVDANNLINAMGFPNAGVDVMIQNMTRLGVSSVPLGVQVTKNKTTDDEQAPGEYGALIDKFAGAAVMPDYFTINVSSPNTPGLRNLQAPEFMKLILDQATMAMKKQNRSTKRLLVKLAPDIEPALVEEVIGLVIQYDIGGIVLTNTTTTRPISSKYDDRPGGFSGSALYDKSSRLVKHAAKHLPQDRVLVAVGGIDTVDRAYEMLQYADLIDGYTGLVLKSPFLFRSIGQGVLTRMRADGVKDLAALRAGNRPLSA